MSAMYPLRGVTYLWKVAVSLLALALCANVLASADENLLLNGDLLEGEHGLPAHWEAQSLRPDIANKTFLWLPQPGDGGQLQITINKVDFARWSQAVRLQPGWYRLLGEIRADGTHPDAATATLGVRVGQRTVGWSPDPGRPNEWNTRALYFKVGSSIKTLEVVCQLTGSKAGALCRRFRLTKLLGAPPPGTRSIDFVAAAEMQARSERKVQPVPFAPPTGNFWSFIVTILMLAAITVSGWLAFGASSSRPTTSIQQDLHIEKVE